MTKTITAVGDNREFKYDADSFTFERVKELIPLNYSKGPWLAGGCVLRFLENTPVFKGDIDIFFSNKRQYNVILNKLLMTGAPVLDRKGGYGYKKSYKVDTFEFGDYKIQLIGNVYFHKMEDVIASFDFSICQAAYDGNRILVNYLDDIINKRLRFINNKTLSRNYRRLFKYMRRGYNPEGEALDMYNALISSCMERDHNGVYYYDNKYLDKLIKNYMEKH